MSDIFDIGANFSLNAPQYAADGFNQAAAPSPVPQGFSIGAEDEPKADIFDLPKNAWNDVKALGPGLNTLGSLAKARVFEATPAGGMHNLIRFFPEKNFNDGSFLPSDFQNIAKVGGAVAGNYYKNYAQPVVNFAQGKGTVGDIFDYPLKHPFNTALDLAPAAKLLGGSKVLNAIKTSEPVQQAVQATKSGAVSLGQKAVQAAYNNDHFANVADWLTDKVAELKESASLSAGLMKRVEKENKLFQSELKPYWDAIPQALRAQVSSYAEGWHPSQWSQSVNVPPAIQAYLDKARDVTQLMQHRITDIVSAEDIAHSSYYPATAQMYGRDAFKALSKDAQEAAIKQVRGEMERRGINPVYSPWMHSKEVRNTLRNPVDLRASSGKWNQRPGFARRKGSDGKGFHEMHYEAVQARFIQISKWQHAYSIVLDKALKAADDLIANTSSHELQEAIANGSLKPVNAHSIYRTIMKAKLKGFSQDELTTALKALPGEVYLPEPMAKALSGLSANQDFFGKLGDILGTTSSIARRYMLGLNPFYPESQLIQNLGMLEYTQVKGVRDAWVSLNAWSLATNPEVRALVPLEIAGGDMAAEAASASASLLQGVDKLVDMNMYRMSVYDSTTRIKAALQLALEYSEAIPEVGGIMNGVLETSSALERVGAVFARPELTNQIAAHVNHVLGDFSKAAMNGPVMGPLRKIALFPAWYKVFWNFASRLPANNPYKTSIMSQMAQTYPKLFGDGRLPQWMQKAGYVPLPGQTNPQGEPQYLGGSSYNPMSTLTELAEMLDQPFNSQSDSTVATAINPLLSLAVFYFGMKKNPASMRDYSDPNLVKYDHKQYLPEDAAAGRFDKEQHPRPNMVAVISRYVFTYPTNIGERIFEKIASGGEKSQFSSFYNLNSAPKKVHNGKDVLQADDWGKLAGSAVVNVFPTSVDLDAEQQQRHFDATKFRKLKQAYFRQQQ